MKRTLRQFLNDRRASKVIVSKKDKDGNVLSQHGQPVKGFKLRLFPVGGKYRFRVLTATDQYIGQRDVVIRKK